MHWLTAVCGFIALYAIGGLVTTLFKSGDADALLFFGCGLLLFIVLGLANEIRTRRKKP